MVTRTAVYPTSIEFPVGVQGRTLYLMLSGTTFAMQSHVVNLRATLEYADGSAQTSDLVNPFDIGDCWNQHRFHDTAANGFENIGWRSGPAGSAEVPDLTRPVAVDTQAHLVAVELKPGATLAKVTDWAGQFQDTRPRIARPGRNARSFPLMNRPGPKEKPVWPVSPSVLLPC